MKKIILTAAISAFALSQSQANNNPEISKMVEEAIQFERGILPLEKNESEFVKMSLKVNEDKKLEVVNANFSSQQIGDIVIDRISELEVDEDLLTNDTLYYHITFKKF